MDGNPPGSMHWISLGVYYIARHRMVQLRHGLGVWMPSRALEVNHNCAVYGQGNEG